MRRVKIGVGCIQATTVLRSMRVVMTMQSFDVGGGVGDFPSAAFLELQGAAKRDQKETGRVGLGFVADKLLIFGNPAQSRPMDWSMKKSRCPWGA